MMQIDQPVSRHVKSLRYGYRKLSRYVEGRQPGAPIVRIPSVARWGPWQLHPGTTINSGGLISGEHYRYDHNDKPAVYAYIQNLEEVAVRHILKREMNGGRAIESPAENERFMAAFAPIRGSSHLRTCCPKSCQNEVAFQRLHTLGHFPLGDLRHFALERVLLGTKRFPIGCVQAHRRLVFLLGTVFQCSQGVIDNPPQGR